ncbi:MAG: PQQ-dependent sugar dehydrogenase [Planctomycetota bacterium]
MVYRMTIRVWLVVAVLLIAPSIALALPDQTGESSYTLKLEPFAEHTGTNAMDVTHAGDGSGRVFVSTQSGQVFVYDADGNSLGVFLDLTVADDNFRFNPENKTYPFRGLMYIAFHPDYAKSGEPGFGRFYTAHQVVVSEAEVDFDAKDFGAIGDSDKRFVLAEWRVDSENPDRIDPASYRPVMSLNFHTYSSNPHGLGEIAFNPFAKPGETDYGKLYLSVGDSHNGDYNKPHNLARAQQTDNPFAKILRIDPLAADDKPYSIPEDNPFSNEDYATGLRDGQWFSFAKDLDEETVLIACDIGALSVEEINVIRSGANYGWDRFEGTEDFNTDRQLTGQARPPVVQYGRFFPKQPGGESTNAGLVAIMGGLVVSDPDDPSFKGQILFGDLPSGALMHANYHHALTMEKAGRQSIPYVMNVTLGDKTGSLADVLGTKRGDARYGFDEANNVYLISKRTGTIFKTGLVFTGRPVESDPSVSKPGVINNTMGLLITIGCVAVLLLIILLLVCIKTKSNFSEQKAIAANDGEQDVNL